MKPIRFSRPPQALRHPSVTLDNVALVPASLLPHKAAWQQIANSMPPGSILVCVSLGKRKQREIGVKVATQLRQKGKRVATLPAERFA